MKHLSLVLVLLMSFSVFAKDCDLSKGLTEKQIKILKKAGNIHRIGLNRTLLGKEVYEIDILSTDNDDQFVVLLGEAHIKGPRSSIMGKRLNKAFKLRMLEGIPKAESDYISENNDELSDSLGWQRILARVITFNFFGSTISAAQKKGLTFLPGYNAVLLNKKVIKREKTETAQDVLKLLPSLIENSEKGLNLPLEVGQFLTPSTDESYILEARNVRMASNITTYLDNRLVQGTPLVILGAAHNPGIAELLAADGFEKCDF